MHGAANGGSSEALSMPAHRRRIPFGDNAGECGRIQFAYFFGFA
jgi:hypothetical protein